MRVRKKLDAIKAGVQLPVNPREMCEPSRVGEVPDTDERAVLRLACAMHRAESRGVAVSWAAQERAAAFYNAHGMARALDEAERLEACPLYPTDNGRDA